MQKLNPLIADSRAGFRFGADEQAWLLYETLRLRQQLPRGLRHTYVTFVDIHKAYDTVWKEALLTKLWPLGVRGSFWRICEAMLADTSACARIGSGTTRDWQNSSGLRQGAIFSPIQFLVYINDLVNDLDTASPGVRLGMGAGAPWVKILLYADDLAIFAESAADLQRALNVIGTWASKWRMTFGHGVGKTAVMSYFGGTSEGMSPFTLAGRALPFVKSYRYLGILVDRNLSYVEHLRNLKQVLRRKLFACCGWGRREKLPLDLLAKLVASYVESACLFGTEMSLFSGVRMEELDRSQRWIGRILFRSPNAPNAIVYGDLAWQPWSMRALERGIGLFSRLCGANPNRLTARVFRFAASTRCSWTSSLVLRMSELGIQLPSQYGITSLCTRALQHRYLSHVVRPRLRYVGLQV